MKIEDWENDKGELIPTRCALPRERMAIPMLKTDWHNGGHKATNCPMYHKLRRYLGLSEAEAIRFGLVVGSRIVILPVLDPTTKCGRMRLRFRMPGEWVKWYDGKVSESERPTMVALKGMSKSQTIQAKRQQQETHRDRKRRRAVVNTGQRYTPKREGFSMALSKRT